MDTILLVNDSPTLTKVLTSHFRKGGFQVIAVQRAVDAYEAFIRNKVDLILTDLVLKDQDGIEVVRTFRAGGDTHKLPIVVFTAVGQDSKAFSDAKEAGADLVLSKQGDSSEILSKIEGLIEDYRSRMPSRSLDDDLGHSIVKSTTEVFRTMMEMKAVPGEITVEKAKPRNAQVIGSIGVAGFLSGSISIFLDRELASESARKMLMMEPEDEIGDDELVDAIGELTNMIGGNIKTELFQKTPLFDISVPSVYIGENLQRRTISDDLCFVVPFTLGENVLHVEFLMITKDKEGEGTGVQNALLESMKT